MGNTHWKLAVSVNYRAFHGLPFILELAGLVWVAGVRLDSAFDLFGF